MNAETFNKIGNTFINLTEAEIAEKINSYASEPKKQFIVINTAHKWLANNGMSDTLPTIVDGIMIGQQQKLARFGDRAYPFSERQVEVLARGLAASYRLLAIVRKERAEMAQ